MSFVALFFFRMQLESCPNRICLAVLGRLLLTLSYFGGMVGGFACFGQFLVSGWGAFTYISMQTPSSFSFFK